MVPVNSTGTWGMSAMLERRRCRGSWGGEGREGGPGLQYDQAGQQENLIKS